MRPVRVTLAGCSDFGSSLSSSLESPSRLARSAIDTTGNSDGRLAAEAVSTVAIVGVLGDAATVAVRFADLDCVGRGVACCLVSCGGEVCAGVAGAALCEFRFGRMMRALPDVRGVLELLGVLGVLLFAGGTLLVVALGLYDGSGSAFVARVVGVAEMGEARGLLADAGVLLEVAGVGVAARGASDDALRDNTGVVAGEVDLVAPPLVRKRVVSGEGVAAAVRKGAAGEGAVGVAAVRKVGAGEGVVGVAAVRKVVAVEGVVGVAAVRKAATGSLGACLARLASGNVAPRGGERLEPCVQSSSSIVDQRQRTSCAATHSGRRVQLIPRRLPVAPASALLLASQQPRPANQNQRLSQR